MKQDFINKLYTNYSQFKSNSTYNSSEEYYDELVYEILHSMTVRKESIICDIGCGNGGKLKSLQKFGYMNLIGIDPLCLETHQPGFSLHPKSIGEYISSVKAKSVDVFILNAVAEHLYPWILEETLRSLKEALTEDGIIIVKSPNAASPYGGFYQFGDLTHLLALTPNSLKQIAELTGLRIARCGNEMLPIRQHKGLKRVVISSLHRIFLFKLFCESILAFKSIQVLTPNFIAVLNREECSKEFS
ncbi:class I SAM-dependent methyltransferase [Ketobacter sp.]|uniref:class I SAM-dependent methyltransferase n=1 Tax=Ketobacter sp. TaxID=2083498 RepID=UPI000F15EDAA|nr:methyltransferase domain-containing protein [Ketobacter sp.]RLT92286.1 MAG: methyltransferase domain-containing protein [Ketobacter sp.]